MFCRSFAGFVLAAFLLTLPAAAPAGAVLSIAHRGNSRYAPENTLAAFLAAKDKADMVETDVHASSDGKLVIMHDSTVDRTTDGTGAIAGVTLAHLKTLDAGSWFGPSFAGERIPTLEEMITNTLPFAMPLIERKAGAAALYVDELRRLNAVTNVVLQSFDWNFLTAVHALEPNLRLGALGSGTFTASTLTSIINSGATIVAWAQGSVTEAVVSLVKGAGLDLYVWTVDDPAAIQNFITLGVDGIISNDPAAVRGEHVVVTNQYGLVAYWKLDDGLSNPAATVMVDSAGENDSVITAGLPGYWLGVSQAQFGGALHVDGQNVYATVLPSSSLDVATNAVSISLWVRLDQLPSQIPGNYAGIYDSTSDEYVVYLDKGSRELRFKVTLSNSQAARPGIPESKLKLGEWLHVVGQYDGSASATVGEARIYLNGELMDVHRGHDGAPGTGLTANVRAGQTAAIGRNGTQATYYYTGAVDDLAIWRRALSAGDIGHIYAAGQGQLSLGDLLIESATSLRVASTHLNAAGTHLEIQFSHEGFWTVFHLERAESCAGPYYRVPELEPTSLGDGLYQFTYPFGAGPMEYFRVVAW